MTIRLTKHHKLSAKFYGPFKILEKVGTLVYKLELLITAQVYTIFHVSQLKKCHYKDLTMGLFPVCDTEGVIVASLYKLLDMKYAKQGNRIAVYGLVQWNNGNINDATRELLTDLQKRFPHFDNDS